MSFVVAELISMAEAKYEVPSEGANECVASRSIKT